MTNSNLKNQIKFPQSKHIFSTLSEEKEIGFVRSDNSSKSIQNGSHIKVNTIMNFQKHISNNESHVPEGFY
jgi:hypothetical protein